MQNAVKEIKNSDQPSYCADSPKISYGNLVNMLQLNSSGVYTEIWNRNVNVNPENVYNLTRQGTRAAFERVRREKFVRIGTIVFTSFFLANEGICDVQLTNSRFFPTALAFATYKGFPYLEMFNKK